MLARKYDNYAWEEQEYQEYQQYQEAPQLRQQEKVNTDPYRGLRNRFMFFAVVVLATYLLSVVRSEAMVTYGSELVSMRKLETQLINKNNELKIEVEQLKGPERIIGLAEQHLGMSVARSNIYVKALGQKNNVNSLAVATK
ncbi:MAG: hypothetical protein SOV56_10240 [Phascolarctobacterium sp.]|nr:hypothetical protein [Phascolarctobacterium sp.]